MEISRREFEAYLRNLLKGLRNLLKNNYEEADLRKLVRDRRPTRIPQIIRSDDMELKKYERLTDAVNDIKVPRETLIYAYDNRRPLIARRKGGVKVFYNEWLN